MLNGKKGDKTKLFGWRYPGFQARFSYFSGASNNGFLPNALKTLI